MFFSRYNNGCLVYHLFIIHFLTVQQFLLRCHFKKCKLARNVQNKNKNILDVLVLFDLVIDNYNNMNISFCRYITLKIEMTNLMINGNVYFRYDSQSHVVLLKTFKYYFCKYLSISYMLRKMYMLNINIVKTTIYILDFNA